jgi:8-oxo-dGTP pyrophosphatase MutT (NUDIX family)
VTTEPLCGLLQGLDPDRVRRSAGDADAAVSAVAQDDLRSGALTPLRADGVRHLTVSCLLVAGHAGEAGVALGLHRKSGQWRQVGGHLEAGDGTLLAAAHRELREESGVDAHVAVREFPVGGRDCASHVDVLFAARVPDRVALQTHDAGIARIEWWSVSALPEGTAPDLRRDLPQLLSRVRSSSAPAVVTPPPRADRS